MVLAILRVRIEEEKLDEFWDYLIENSEKILSEFGNDAKILYVTKRAGYSIVSIFIITDDPDIIGTFIMKKISRYNGVIGVWLLNLINMKFFHIPPEIPLYWKRYTITLSAMPKDVGEVYDALSKTEPSETVSPVYIGLTFHLFGWDCIMMSLLAKDESALQQFITEKIKNLGRVEVKQIAQVEKSKRMISQADWVKYAKTHVIPEGCGEKLVLDVGDL